MYDKVAEVIAIIRPAVLVDGGDVVLCRVDEAAGVVTLELTGSCVGCPSSTLAMKAGIERILKDRVAAVVEVRLPGVEHVETGTAVSL